MLCYVMLCYVMLCYVMLCYVMLCYVMLCYVMLCYVMLCYVMLCYVMLCHVMLCNSFLLPWHRLVVLHSYCPRGIAIAIPCGFVVYRRKGSLFERSVRKCVSKDFHHFVL